LVADDDCRDRLGKPPGEIQSGLDLIAVELRKAREPQPLQNAHPVALCDGRNPVEAMIDGVGAHAVGDRFELGQILLNLAWVDWNVGSERVLAAPERGI